MKKIISLRLMSAITAAIITLSAVSANAADCSSPQKYVDSLSKEVVAVIQTPATDAAKEAKLTVIFKRIVDTNWMGKFVLGRNWKNLTPEQQTTYLAKYSDYLIASYVPTFRKYSGEKINVGAATNLEKEGEYSVNTTIERPGKESVVVNYRVRKEGNCFKVADIVAEGISLINTQRQDFNAVYSRKGYDGLIESLNRKIAAGPAALPESVK